MGKVQIRYFSGYIRNWNSLCAELGIAQPLNRKEREEQILTKAYEKWKMRFMEHLCGMFAVVLFDEDAQKLYCVRDQVGQKQMFYAVVEGELLCSGDINEIVADKRFEKKLNMRMLQQYLFYGYPIGAETFYQDVFKKEGGAPVVNAVVTIVCMEKDGRINRGDDLAARIAKYLDRP